MNRRTDFRVLLVIGMSSAMLVAFAAALVIREVVEWVERIQLLLRSLPQ